MITRAVCGKSGLQAARWPLWRTSSQNFGVFRQRRQLLSCVCCHQRLDISNKNVKLYSLPLITRTQYLSKSSSVNYSSEANGSERDRRPNAEQLEIIYLKLSEMLPNFFSLPHDYTIYAQDLVFEDNIRKIRTQGLQAYVQNISVLRIMAHIKYSHVRLNVLKITQHPEDFTVRVRWRVVGVPGFFSLDFWRQTKSVFSFDFWKHAKKSERFLKTDSSGNNANWTDGFSVFYLNEEGLIYKHVADKLMPDDGKDEVKTGVKLAAKLGLLFGLVAPRTQDSHGASSWLNELFSLFF